MHRLLASVVNCTQGYTMTLDLDKTIFGSQFAGLGNSQNVTPNPTFAYTGEMLAGGQIKTIGTVTALLNNANSITSVQVNLGLRETEWRPVEGYMQKTFDSGGFDNHDVIITTRYTGRLLTITMIVADDTGLSNLIAPINFEYRINTYAAPFAS